MHVQGSLRTQLPSQLTDGLQERLALDVSNGAANLGDHKVEMFLGGVQLDTTFDFIGDVRDHLDGLAQIVAPALALDHAHVDAPCGHTVVAGGLYAREPLIMPEVQIGLHAIHGHIAFAMLVRIQSSRINVDVRVEFLDGDLVSARLEQFA